MGVKWLTYSSMSKTSVRETTAVANQEKSGKDDEYEKNEKDSKSYDD